MNERTLSIHKMLRGSKRNRLVAPTNQPFAFVTHRGRVRTDNQDTVLVLAGRRSRGEKPYTAAILCDGMGGHEHGALAADLAAATASGVMASGEILAPEERMRQSIVAANDEVFRNFGGKSGAVLVSTLVENDQKIIGWVGDARAYGLLRDEAPHLITNDDTVAAEVERIEGKAEDALDVVLLAVGSRATLIPHVEIVTPEYESLLLTSDGIHRIEPEIMAWVCRYAQNNEELVRHLQSVSQWVGGLDNATALALSLCEEPSLDEEGEVLSVWVEEQPRIWQILVNSSLKPDNHSSQKSRTEKTFSLSDHEKHSEDKSNSDTRFGSMKNSKIGSSKRKENRPPVVVETDLGEEGEL